MNAGDRVRAALLGVLLSLVLAPPLAAQTDTALSDIGVQVKFERGPDSLLLSLARADSVMLLPLREFLGLAEILITQLEPGRRIEARLGSPAIEFGLDTERGRSWRGQGYAPLDPRDAVWRDGELYVATPLLAHLLGVQMVTAWPDLMVLVSVSNDLPVVQRLARERRRAVMLRPAPDEADILPVGGRAALLDGLAVDWAVTGASREPLDNSTVQLGVGTTVLGGGLDILTTSVRTPQVSQTETFWSWTMAWDNRNWLRQARLGDVNSGGPRGVPMQGFNVSNSPFLRPAGFATEMLLGRLDAGWQVEVYRGEQLVGYTPVGEDGRYGLDVPVVYGQNPLETVAYGPHGEVRRIQQTFMIPFERLAENRFEYNLGVGRCRRVPCQGTGNLDLRYGVTDRITVQAGVDAFTRDTLQDLVHPYGLVTLGLTRPLSLTTELVGGAFGRSRLDFDPSADLHADLGYTAFDTSVAQPMITSRLVSQQADGQLFWRPGWLAGELFFQGAAVWQSGEQRTHRGVRASATTRLMGTRGSVGWRFDETEIQGGGTTVQAGMDLGADGVVARGPLRNTFLRAAAGIDCFGTALHGCRGRLTRWTAGLGRQLLRVFRLDVGVRKDADADLSVEVALTAGFPFMRATSRNIMTGSGEVTGSQVFEGSVLWNRRQGRVNLGSGRNLGRAGVVGTVFFDANSDGMQQGDEPGLDGVALRIGTNAVITDSLGRFRSWDLVPFVNTIIEVDTLSLANPLWYPSVGALRIPPSPNAFRYVAVAVREGGEVNGRVEFEGRPVAGARLLVTDARGKTREVTTFTDGAFYIMRLPMGAYDIRVAPELLDQIGAHGGFDRFVINPGTMRVDGLVVRIQR